MFIKPLDYLPTLRLKAGREGKRGIFQSGFCAVAILLIAWSQSAWAEMISPVEDNAIKRSGNWYAAFNGTFGTIDRGNHMYHTGIDPESMKRVQVAKGDKQRAMQRALLQYFKPENYDLVKRALRAVDREDLIGDEPDCLIGERRPRVTRSVKSGLDGNRGGKRGGYRWAARNR